MLFSFLGFIFIISVISHVLSAVTSCSYQCVTANGYTVSFQSLAPQLPLVAEADDRMYCSHVRGMGEQFQTEQRLLPKGNYMSFIGTHLGHFFGLSKGLRVYCFSSQLLFI